MSKLQAEAIYNQMIDQMPFKLSDDIKPYIIEAMEVYSYSQLCARKDAIKEEHILSGLNNVIENGIYRDGQKAMKKRILTKFNN